MSKYYAVKVGRNPGIYLTWNECKEQVNSFSGTVYKSFTTRQEAENYISENKQYPLSRDTLTYDIDAKKCFLEDGIYVDGCCNNTIGSCSSVTDKYGNCLVKKNLTMLSEYLPEYTTKEHGNRIVYEVNFDDVKSQQNNGAELLALVVGLIISIEGKNNKIFSDSTLMVNHWSNKLSNTIKCPRKARLQEMCVKLTTIYKGKIIHISGDINPADLGFHKN